MGPGARREESKSDLSLTHATITAGLANIRRVALHPMPRSI
jgi:hypothetical protein